MYSRVLTASLYGLSGEKTWVETDCDNGLPCFSVVGLATQSVKESRERIRAAIINCGYEFPVKKITVNLTPADRKKDGTHFDLPMALSLLMSADIAKVKEYDDAILSGQIACFGELTLDGKVRPVSGALPMIIGLQRSGVERIIIPKDNLKEAMLVKGMLFYPVESLEQVIDFVTGFEFLDAVEASGYTASENEGASVPDFGDIRGQETAKRAAQIAAAGMHGMLMIGPPGVGKTMIGKRIPGIMPPLTYQEQLDVTQIYSVAGGLGEKNPMITVRPFRSPHHSVTPTSLIGGGVYPRPGEISLAHTGVLFLDELPEFSAQTLEMLRQPLEDGQVVITRLYGNVIYPSSFMLVAAMNPCRCGYYGDPVKICTCTEGDRARYMGKVSGPLLDRIDLHVSLERIVYTDITTESTSPATDTASLRKGVLAAAEIQRERYANLDINYNSQLNPKLIKKYCRINKAGDDLLEAAFSKWNMSARSYHRILKLARTVADIEQSEEIREEHILEALSYRMPEKYFQ